MPSYDHVYFIKATRIFVKITFYYLQYRKGYIELRYSDYCVLSHRDHLHACDYLQHRSIPAAEGPDRNATESHACVSHSSGLRLDV